MRKPSLNAVGSTSRSKSEHRMAPQILRQAIATIEQRGKQRDSEDGERSMARTVQAFNVIFGTNLTEAQGWQFMELLKIVRSVHKHNDDDYLDGAAYAALAGEASGNQRG